MKPQSKSPEPFPGDGRCHYVTAANRRCRSLTSRDGTYCLKHAWRQGSPDDFCLPLINRSHAFRCAHGINNSLTDLYAALAAGAISPRRASVLTHISSLLLRTLPAIHEQEHVACAHPAHAEFAQQNAQARQQQAAPAPLDSPTSALDAALYPALDPATYQLSSCGEAGPATTPQAAHNSAPTASPTQTPISAVTPPADSPDTNITAVATVASPKRGSRATPNNAADASPHKNNDKNKAAASAHEAHEEPVAHEAHAVHEEPVTHKKRAAHEEKEEKGVAVGCPENIAAENNFGSTISPIARFRRFGNRDPEANSYWFLADKYRFDSA
jgi:hypothetical protein